MFLWKGVLKICSKFTGQHPCRSVNSPENSLHIFRTPFYKNICGGLLKDIACQIFSESFWKGPITVRLLVSSVYKSTENKIHFGLSPWNYMPFSEYLRGAALSHNGAALSLSTLSTLLFTKCMIIFQLYHQSKYKFQH